METTKFIKLAIAGLSLIILSGCGKYKEVDVGKEIYTINMHHLEVLNKITYNEIRMAVNIAYEVYGYN
jgi:hypothetical protein